MKQQFSLDGIDFPKNLPEFDHRFRTEEACIEYLREQRWPEGFRCPKCMETLGWTNVRGKIECSNCHHQTSVTSGTIMHGTRLPYRLWFRAMWWVCTQKTGLSAAGLRRLLGLSSMQTAWVWMQKLRKAMVRLEREPLAGQVQVDDFFLGEDTRAKSGSWKGAHVVAALEINPRTGEIGRLRLKQIMERSGSSILYFISREIGHGAILETDDRKEFSILDETGWNRKIITKDSSTKVLPRVRRIIPMVVRWLMGTHQGRVERKHLQGYLDEFVFRFNRRKSPHVGLLFQRLVSQGMQIQATTYKALIEHE